VALLLVLIAAGLLWRSLYCVESASGDQRKENESVEEGRKNSLELVVDSGDASDG